MSRVLENPSSPQGPRVRPTRPVILCVDDDPEISRTIEVRLRTYDVEVRRAFHGMQGLWESMRKRPDLIIMDLAMPNGDGCHVLRCLRSNKQTATIPVIVLTGMRDPALAARVMNSGADQLVRKPVSFDILLKHMSRHVELRSDDFPSISPQE
jgi:DNA-binding response OmpR family regulator